MFPSPIDSVNQRKYLRAIAWFMVIGTPPLWIGYWFFAPSLFNLTLSPILFTAGVLILCFARKPQQINTAAHLLSILLVFGICSSMYFPGSDTADIVPNISSLGSLLLVVFLLTERLTGAILAGITAGLILIGLALHNTGIISHPLDAGLVVTLCIGLVIYSAAAYAMNTIQLKYVIALAKEKASVEVKVTERTEQLRTEQAKLKASIESLNIGVVMIDADNNVILTNQALAHILGSTTESPSIESLAKLIEQDPSHPESPFDYLDNVRRSQKPVTIETAKAGDKIIHIFISPVEFTPGSTGIVCLIEDITEREILNRSKDEFFSIASHELRTPLTAIKGNASMALSYHQEALKAPGLHEMVDDIHTSSVRLIEIVNDFLDMSRLEQGKIQFKPQQFAIDKIIEQVTYEMAAVLEQKGLYLKVDDAVKKLDSLPQVLADPDRTKQVLYNLVGNAAKFTAEGGISIAVQTEGKYLRVLVHDTGRGISMDSQKLLFRKFQQANASILTRDTTRGTGLGLYISKLMIEGMGGQIGLDESETDQGSTFFFTLPIGKQPVTSSQTTKALASAPVAKVPAAAPTPASPRLLIFEDDPYVQRLYKRLFTLENYTIELASDGGEAVPKTKAFKPNLILLDIMMPKANGLLVLEQLKKDKATKNIPVIMLTNFGEFSTIEKAHKLGVVGYLIKSDFAPEQLLAEVKKHIAS